MNGPEGVECSGVEGVEVVLTLISAAAWKLKNETEQLRRWE